jgi:hypothetical protein
MLLRQGIDLPPISTESGEVHPMAMLSVPGNGLAESVLQADTRRPAKKAVGLGSPAEQSFNHGRTVSRTNAEAGSSLGEP